ncbi:hypothetical protein DCCM_4009 [Desulfocucumis palustris]|uniref:Uncharacterized protein n=1 Tax=Desulfocucumis palustris TaxID=1898651 RepID=A0A2L2XEV1_9FIRM|nr:hypothetical protein DCCM_4009 [Desulfocucumis palustris]
MELLKYHFVKRKSWMRIPAFSIFFFFLLAGFGYWPVEKLNLSCMGGRAFLGQLD